MLNILFHDKRGNSYCNARETKINVNIQSRLSEHSRHITSNAPGW